MHAVYRHDEMMKIGHHVSIAQRIDLSFDRASALGYTAMQIFTSNPRQWHAKKLGEEEVLMFRKKQASTGIEAVAHMPYLANLASSNKAIYAKSVEMLKEQAERCKALGIGKLVVHAGSNPSKREGMKKVIEALNSISHEGLAILLENEAGQKNSIGSSIDDLALMLEDVEGEKGACIDTCHAFAAGYEIGKEFARECKKLGIGAIHLNDAKYERGSGRDRHENLGFGKIGLQNLSSFFSGFSRSELEELPIIMETPMSTKISEKAEFELAKKTVLNGYENK